MAKLNINNSRDAIPLRNLVMIFLQNIKIFSRNNELIISTTGDATYNCQSGLHLKIFPTFWLDEKSVRYLGSLMESHKCTSRPKAIQILIWIFTFDRIESAGKIYDQLNNSNCRDAILLRKLMMIFLQNEMIFSYKN